MTYLHKLARRLATVRIGVLCATAAVACSKGEQRDFLSPNPGSPAELVSINISPRVGSVRPGETIRFSASGTSHRGQTMAATVQWSASGGTITPDGVFTSDRFGQFKVVARATSAPQIGDSATVAVFVSPKDVLVVAVSPDSSEVFSGEGLQLEANARLADGTQVASPPLSWSADGGAVDGSGWFVAPEGGDRTFVVSATASSGVQGSARVVVRNQKRVLQRVIVTPDAVTVGGGQSYLFTADGLWSDGSEKPPSVVWSSTGGAIASDGTYTAGSSSGNYLVIARDKFSTLADTSRVSVTEPTITAVTVSPGSTSLAPGATQQYAATARMSDGTNRSVGVAWRVNGGSITAAGLYTATPTPGSYEVVGQVPGTALADSGAIAVAQPTATLNQVILNPATASVPVGQARQFSVTGTWSDGSTRAPAVTWNATGGTLTAGGLFTAGMAQGTFRVIATETGGTKADTSVITVTPSVLTALVLNPSSVTLQAGLARQFAVSGVWSDGSTGAPAVSWLADGGTMAADGIYTAGTTPGTYRVIAAQQAGTLADTSLITIALPEPVPTALSLAPASVTLSPGGAYQFAVSATWTNGGTGLPGLTWTATGGTVSATGLLRAPTTVGTYQVVVSQTGGSLADTSVVTVSSTAPVLASLSLSPATTTLQTTGTRQFSVTGTMSDGSAVSPAVNWSAHGGTITNGGLYVAGTATGTFPVIATQVGGALTDTSFVTITTPPTLVSVAVKPDTVVLGPGQSAQLSATGTYSTGSTSTASVVWSATGGSISTSGLYTAGTAGGTFRAVAVVQGSTLADTAVVSITSASVTGFMLSPASVTLQRGATRQFSVAATWSDGVSRPVTLTYGATGGMISVEGLYTAGQAIGSFFVIASCGCGVADTSVVAITDAPTAVSQVVLNPPSASLLPGASQQFTASAILSDGSTTAAAATYSLSPGAGTITSGGLFTAGNAAGEYSVIASDPASGLADTAAIAILPPSASSIALSVKRWSPGSGMVLVSNGIPLPPGALFASGLGGVRLFVAGAEQSIHVEALAGTHRDGSLRSILVQFNYNLDDVVSWSGQLDLTGGRTRPDLARVVPSGNPDATALPSSADYLVSTNLAGPMITVARARTLTLPASVASEEADFPVIGGQIWSNYGPAYQRGIAVYDHAFTHYQYWFRSGDPVWWKRATAMAMSYRAYADPLGKLIAPWMVNSESLVLHYWLTGDEGSRNEVGVMANAMLEACRGPQYDNPSNTYWIGGTLGDDRMRARCLMSAIDANLVVAPLTGSQFGGYTSRTKPTEALNDLLPTQASSGAFGGTFYYGGQKNYMVGMLVTAITRYYDEIQPDARIPEVVRKAADYLWTTQWVADSLGFKYISNNLNLNEGTTKPEPGLNGLVLPLFSWYYRFSGNALYRDRADALILGLRRRQRDWIGFPMQFDQAYYRFGNYLYDRQSR